MIWRYTLLRYSFGYLFLFLFIPANSTLVDAGISWLYHSVFADGFTSYTICDSSCKSDLDQTTLFGYNHRYFPELLCTPTTSAFYVSYPTAIRNKMVRASRLQIVISNWWSSLFLFPHTIPHSVHWLSIESSDRCRHTVGFSCCLWRWLLLLYRVRLGLSCHARADHNPFTSILQDFG